MTLPGAVNQRHLHCRAAQIRDGAAALPDTANQEAGTSVLPGAANQEADAREHRRDKTGRGNAPEKRSASPAEMQDIPTGVRAHQFELRVC